MPLFGWLWKKSTEQGKTLITQPKSLAADSGDLPQDDLPVQDSQADDTPAYLSSDAIAQYQQHLQETAQKYRAKAEEWKQLAIGIEAQLPAALLFKAHTHPQPLLTLLAGAVKSLGESLLHQLFVFAGSKLRHLLNDIHEQLREGGEQFQQKCIELENAADKTKEEQLLLKLQIVKMGVVIWNELSNMEVNVSSLIRGCIGFQKGLEKIANVGANLGQDVLFGIIIASLGNLDALKALKVHRICWEDSYRDYLNNAIDSDTGKRRIDLWEMNFAGLLEHGATLVKAPVVLKQDKNNSFFTPEHTDAIKDRPVPLRRTVSSIASFK